jgi:IS1 family transposase
MECRKIIWSCINPKLKSLTSKDYGKRDLFRLGLLEKVSKRLEAERTLDKVKTYNKKSKV